MKNTLIVVFYIIVIISCSLSEKNEDILREKAQKGDLKAVYDLGVINAEKGDFKAMYDLGIIYYHGLAYPDGFVIIKKNIKKANKYFKNAFEGFEVLSKQNSAEAYYYLGELYTNGYYVPKNEYKAIELYVKSANNGYINAYQSLCNYYMEQKNYREAAKWRIKHAETGDEFSIIFVANCFRKGMLGFPKNYSEAIKWYLKLYEKSEAERLKKGKVSKDEDCRYVIGEIYDDMKNYKEAFKWFNKSVESGEEKAFFMLGLYYQYGLRAVPRDKIQAYKWYSISVSLNNSKVSGEQIKELEKTLSSSDILKAQNIASEWISKNQP